MHYYSSLFTLTQSFLYLRNFVAKSALSQLCSFWGELLAEIWWRGAQRHFSGPGVAVSIRVSLWCNHLHDARENPIFPVLHRARCCVLVEEFLQPEETEYSR